MNRYTGTDNLEIMSDAINYNKYLVNLIKRRIKKSDFVLDFGAGIGTFAERLTNDGYNIQSLEVDELQAKEIEKKSLPVATTIAEFSSESLDAIYSLNVLEHIEDDVAALKTLDNKLKKGGTLLIYVPAFMCLYSTMDKKVGHFRRYRKSDLVHKINIVGMKIESARYADSLGFLASLLFRFLGDESGSINRKTLIFYDRIVFPISRILDLFLYKFVGKNLIVIARKI